MNPKVVAVDVAFAEYSRTATDRALYNAFMNASRLVLPRRIQHEGKDGLGKDVISVPLTCSWEFFRSLMKAGFVSLKVEEGQPQIPDQFIVWQERYTGDIYQHFSVVTAMRFDSLRALNFVKHTNDW